MSAKNNTNQSDRLPGGRGVNAITRPEETRLRADLQATWKEQELL